MTRRCWLRIELPDVNVLLALLDPMHPHHETASRWYAGSSMWATCPLTENGFVRVLSSPSYPGIRLRPEDALTLLETTIANPVVAHRFWPDAATLRDRSLFTHSAIMGPKQLTDIYLLGLCQQEGGTLITLDAGISTSAIVSPQPDLLRIL
jgi:toxin-antitoxin system PIN domain toxin